METTMYDTLLQLPLFQGLCKDDFTAIIEKVKFHFQHYKKNEIIIKQGEVCNHLTFLLNGEVTSITIDSLQGYTLTETFQGPYIIEPYSLFGMSTNYMATYQAHTDVQILTIEKSFVYTELNNYEIFRLNYLNILSSRITSVHWPKISFVSYRHVVIIRKAGRSFTSPWKIWQGLFMSHVSTYRKC